MTGSTMDAFADMLWSEPEGGRELNRYVILDGARDDRVFPMVHTSGLDFACLLSGKLPRALAKAAPYLLELRPNHPFLHRVLEAGWGRSWGFFFTSDEELAVLRRHFRGFLKVKNDRTGKSMFFRFFDPRVLRVYLPTCTGEELVFVLDPVDTCYVEGEDPAEAWAFSLDYPAVFGEEVTLVRQVLPLGESPPMPAEEAPPEGAPAEGKKT